MSRTVKEECSRAFDRGTLSGLGGGLLIGAYVTALADGSQSIAASIMTFGFGLASAMGYFLRPSWEDEEWSNKDGGDK